MNISASVLINELDINYPISIDEEDFKGKTTNKARKIISRRLKQEIPKIISSYKLTVDNADKLAEALEVIREQFIGTLEYNKIINLPHKYLLAC